MADYISKFQYNGTTWDMKDKEARQALASCVNNGYYDSNAKKIILRHDSTTIVQIDATDFIKDGMVSNVQVVNGYLVITFNTDAGQEPIRIPITDIFNPDNYYTKSATNGLLALKQDIIQDLAQIRQGASAGSTAYQKPQGGIPLSDINQNGIDNVPTNGSNNLVRSGGVQNELALGAVYDVSAHNNSATFASLQALLSNANIDTLIPTSVRRGGMSIKFVQSSDNKYVQYRLMSDTFNTTVSNWQGIDDEPTVESENLVKSGGVADGLQSVAKQLTGTISASLTKGQIDNSTYQDKASNYALRTDFIDYANLASVKVNSPYSCRFYYYNSQKVGLYNSTNFIPYDERYSYIRVVITGGEGRAETWENIGFELNYSNSLNERLGVVEKNANYSQYDVILEQGVFAFANGSKVNSNVYVRTRLLTYAFIGKVTMSGSYIMYAFFYGQNKTYISYTQLTFTDGECVLPNVQNAVYVAFVINNSDGTNIQPSDVTSVRLYPKEQEQDDFDTLKALRSYAIVNILEQGTLVHGSGIEAGSTKYVRTPYIPYNALYKVQANNGYIVHRFLYTDIDEFIGSSHDTIDVSQGYVMPYNATAKYIRFSIQKTDTSANITPNDNIGFNLYGLNTYREDILNEENTRNFIRANAHSLPILAGCFAPNANGHAGYTDFCCFAVTDLHGDWGSLDDTKSAMQYTRTNILQGAYANRPLNCVCCGDMCTGKPKEGGTVVPQVAQYMSYAQEMGIYHTMGQHEVGFYDTVDGRNKGNCFSHQEVFDYFISPMKSVWGLPNLDTIYYYKDLVDSKVRLISLYQFNIPLVDDPTDSNLYKYPRMQVWYGQDQINWFIQTLASTPSDYRVIVLMHESEAPVLPTPKKIFFTGSSIMGGNTIINGTPIYDIVSAYIAKTTLSQTYTCINKVKYPIEDFTLSVNADFSQATGDFACFMTGDAHVDYMGVIENTTLVNIGITATSRNTYDFTLYDEIKKEVSWTGNNAGSSIVTCLGFCHNGRLIKVGRLGQQYSNIGDYRNYGAITY